MPGILIHTQSLTVQVVGHGHICRVIYDSIIRPVIEHGSVVYGSAWLSALKVLDPIHNEGMGLTIGACRMSLIKSLHAEGNEWSIKRQRNFEHV